MWRGRQHMGRSPQGDEHSAGKARHTQRELGFTSTMASGGHHRGGMPHHRLPRAPGCSQCGASAPQACRLKPFCASKKSVCAVLVSCPVACCALQHALWGHKSLTLSSLSPSHCETSPHASTSAKAQRWPVDALIARWHVSPVTNRARVKRPCSNVKTTTPEHQICDTKLVPCDTRRSFGCGSTGG
jgi:hypothetical protein